MRIKFPLKFIYSSNLNLSMKKQNPSCHKISLILAIGGLLAPNLFGDVPREIETLIKQKEEAIERIDVTFKMKLRDLRAKYVTQGRDKDVALIDKVMKGIDPQKVGDPVIGKWLMKHRDDMAETEISENGYALIGLARGGQVRGTWKRVDDKVQFMRFGTEGVYSEITIEDGKLVYSIPYKGRPAKMVGKRMPK